MRLNVVCWFWGVLLRVKIDCKLNNGYRKHNRNGRLTHFNTIFSFSLLFAKLHDCIRHGTRVITNNIKAMENLEWILGVCQAMNGPKNKKK